MRFLGAVQKGWNLDVFWNDHFLNVLSFSHLLGSSKDPDRNWASSNSGQLVAVEKNYVPVETSRCLGKFVGIEKGSRRVDAFDLPTVEKHLKIISHHHYFP